MQEGGARIIGHAMTEISDAPAYGVWVCAWSGKFTMNSTFAFLTALPFPRFC